MHLSTIPTSVVQQQEEFKTINACDEVHLQNENLQKQLNEHETEMQQQATLREDSHIQQPK